MPIPLSSPLEARLRKALQDVLTCVGAVSTDRPLPSEELLRIVQTGLPEIQRDWYDSWPKDGPSDDDIPF